ncbi:hypothetical protein SLEP1_g18628 [Rubroshorea leprosula]|uniref:Uncharacterized protein n=1 Tax=Rubroshorea leprosula TaxID=152421 RepID=A0AAV5J7B9_9ROSI|nr:hypothetical protein SLEP1_g18628 [Rubroshorea leprosula]
MTSLQSERTRFCICWQVFGGVLSVVSFNFQVGMFETGDEVLTFIEEDDAAVETEDEEVTKGGAAVKSRGNKGEFGEGHEVLDGVGGGGIVEERGGDRGGKGEAEREEERLRKTRVVL